MAEYCNHLSYVPARRPQYPSAKNTSANCPHCSFTISRTYIGQRDSTISCSYTGQRASISTRLDPSSPARLLGYAYALVGSPASLPYSSGQQDTTIAKLNPSSPARLQSMAVLMLASISSSNCPDAVTGPVENCLDASQKTPNCGAGIARHGGFVQEGSRQPEVAFPPSSSYAFISRIPGDIEEPFGHNRRNSEGAECGVHHGIGMGDLRLGRDFGLGGMVGGGTIGYDWYETLLWGWISAY
ncbi:hypothetical protein BU16DRAFT_554151 [Lophium mytilinum]|uniref:Uncharacterized protein n=1 Tax=Lophium mytilinum TaxID=390894 RepID=A0A6A6RBA4_9PEZI|nr:hypothetical protein BU16DRAFT_554151 [Lophium mytilinum]